MLLLGLLRARSLDRSAVTGAAIGSVVPPVTAPLAEACERWLGVVPLIIDARAGLPIVLQVDEPRTVGADRILNTLAASRLYGVDTVVVDLGTATTYDCITAEGVFLGGVIAPGLRTSADTLFRRTSKLPATELVPPAHAIGTRTEECIRAGVLFGAADAIDGLVRRIKAEWPTKRVPKIVATGGLAPLIASICREIDIVEPHSSRCTGSRSRSRFSSTPHGVSESAQRRSAEQTRVRRLGYRLLPGDGFSYLLHMRPREWPIMIAHTTLGFVLAQGVGATARGTRLSALVAGLALWVVLLNGGTLAINSAFDNDEGDIGYLDAPPPPPAHRAVWLCLDGRGAGNRARLAARLRDRLCHLLRNVAALQRAARATQGRRGRRLDHQHARLRRLDTVRRMGAHAAAALARRRVGDRRICAALRGTLSAHAALQFEEDRCAR